MRRTARLLSAAMALGLIVGLVACAPDTPAPDEPSQGAERPSDPPPASEQPGAPGDGAPTNGMCGGIAGIQCASTSDYCAYPLGQCRLPDASGTCTPRADICTKEYRPVCGCDGKTYGNDCEAAAAGVSVFAEGQCGAPEGEAE